MSALDSKTLMNLVQNWLIPQASVDVLLEIKDAAEKELKRRGEEEEKKRTERVVPKRIDKDQQHSSGGKTPSKKLKTKVESGTPKTSNTPSKSLGSSRAGNYSREILDNLEKDLGWIAGLQDYGDVV